MTWTSVIVAGLAIALKVGGAGVDSTAVADENPACENPSQGFAKSVETLTGRRSNAPDRIVNARTKIGCKNVQPS